MKVDVIPAQLEIKRDDNEIVKSAVLRLGGRMAAPFKWVQYDIWLDNYAHLQPIDPEENNTSTFELYKDKDFSGGGYLLCTQCKYKFSFGAYHILEYDNFCPHCGRKIIRQADPDTITLTFTRQEGGGDQ